MPLQMIQDGELLGEERFIRRVFVPKDPIGSHQLDEQQRQQQQQQFTLQSEELEEFSESIQMVHMEDPPPLQQCQPESKFTLARVIQKSFLGVNQSFVIARKKKLSSKEIAIRIRTGSGGRSEWLNELQVYLIADFRHINILGHLGSDQLQDLVKTTTKSKSIRPSRMLIRDELPRISDIKKQDYLLDQSYEEQEEATEDLHHQLHGGVKIRLQYWLLNRFDNCIVLRDYLRDRALDWPQMIHIARGIINGLHYLHEHGDYQNVDKEQAVQGFIKSTNGVLRRVVFVDKGTKILMWPQYTCSIVHRNLNSMNIVLRGPELTPCIWNFSHSKIQHPFQPTNHIDLIDPRLKKVFMSSPYSPPEVLQERAHLTLTAMKSIDMYACGILFWELLSRCRLPKLVDPSGKVSREQLDQENRERNEPEPYYEPFERELGPKPSAGMLAYAVCRRQARPKLKNCWLVGERSYNFARTIQDLWDQDYDARVHTSTVMDRLERIDLSNNNNDDDDDNRHNFSPRNSKSFNFATDWPPKVQLTPVPPFLDKCEPNFIYLDP